jgi:hypothetical protein
MGCHYEHIILDYSQCNVSLYFANRVGYSFRVYI